MATSPHPSQIQTHTMATSKASVSKQRGWSSFLELDTSYKAGAYELQEV